MSNVGFDRWLRLLNNALGYDVLDDEDMKAAERAWRGGQTPTQYAQRVKGRLP